MIFYERKRLGLIPLIVLTMVGLIYFIANNGRLFNNSKTKSYEELKIEDSLCNTVKSIYSNHCLYFTFDNERKLYFISLYNYEYEEPSLEYNMEIGDSVIKKANNDTIILIKMPEHEELFFILNKLINQGMRE